MSAAGLMLDRYVLLEQGFPEDFDSECLWGGVSAPNPQATYSLQSCVWSD